MPKIREYQGVGHDFIREAPVAEVLRQPIPASSAATFRCLEDGAAWPVWLEPIDEVRWTSAKPFGVGTTRDIVNRMGVVSEYFFDWDDGRRMSFHFARGPIPALEAFAEDYEVVPTGPDSCDLVWSYGVAFNGPFAKALEAVFGFGFKRSARKSLVQLAELMQTNKARYA